MKKDIIKRYICPFCLNSDNCCLKINTKNINNTKIYKCINYQKKTKNKGEN